MRKPHHKPAHSNGSQAIKVSYFRARSAVISALLRAHVAHFACPRLTLISSCHRVPEPLNESEGKEVI